MTKEKWTSRYPKKSIGHVLDALRNPSVHNLNETIAGSVTVGSDYIHYQGKPFATYKYFQEIEQPLFRFAKHVFGQHMHTTEDGKTLKSNFHLGLSESGVPSLEVFGFDADKALYDFLERTIKSCQYSMLDTPSGLVKNAGAVFSANFLPVNEEPKNSNRIIVLFHKPKGAQAFIDYVNENLVRPILI